VILTPQNDIFRMGSKSCIEGSGVPHQLHIYFVIYFVLQVSHRVGQHASLKRIAYRLHPGPDLGKAVTRS
jgi:hypothetical protein